MREWGRFGGGLGTIVGQRKGLGGSDVVGFFPWGVLLWLVCGPVMRAEYRIRKWLSSGHSDRGRREMVLLS